MKTLQGLHKRAMTVAVGLIALAGCASHQSPPSFPLNQPPQWVQVPVLATLPMTDPAAQQACPVPTDPAAHAAQPSPPPPDVSKAVPITQQGFCVSYFFNGQSFSVGLPTDPGEHLTLQWPLPQDIALTPLPPAGAMLPYAGSAPYPYLYGGVFLGGVYYRPRPYVMPSGRGGRGDGGGRGRRSGHR
jgi:hypothetical protein